MAPVGVRLHPPTVRDSAVAGATVAVRVAAEFDLGHDEAGQHVDQQQVHQDGPHPRR